MYLSLNNGGAVFDKLECVNGTWPGAKQEKNNTFVYNILVNRNENICSADIYKPYYPSSLHVAVYVPVYLLES